MNTLNIYTLGGVAINLNDAPLKELSSRKAKALLVYLAYTGRPHQRQSLATFLWGDGEEKQLVANLRRELTQLRRYLSPYIEMDDEAVSFSTQAPYHMDVIDLKAALSAFEEKQALNSMPLQTDTAQIERAMALYQGEFLEGFPQNTSRYFDKWLASERTQLREHVTMTLHRIISTYLEVEAYSAAIAPATWLLHLDPLDEEAHYQLMDALVHIGQRRAALAHYEEYATFLNSQRRSEPPAAATTELYQKIREERLPFREQRSVPHHNLPPEPSRFVGRSVELTQITRRLNDAACRLLTLVGIGGAGKTRLALKVASIQLDHFADGVYCVPLISITSPDNVAGAVAQAIGYLPATPGDIRPQLINYLADKQLLLLLDSFEHLQKSADLVGEILAQAPQVKILVTSQQALGLYEEWLFPVQGLCGADEPDDSAIELFVQSANKVEPALTAEDNLESIRRICRLVEGLPLAIELAAAWSRFMPISQIAEQVEHDLNFLAAGWTNVPERHRSVRTLFERTWGLLSPAECAMLMSLSIFTDHFTAEAAMSVAQSNRAMLASLVGKSLLQRAPASDRYTMHNLIRQFAREKLADSGQNAAALDRHLNYYVQLAEEAETRLSGTEQSLWLDRLDSEHNNLYAALVWSCRAESNPEPGSRLAGALWPFWRIRGYLDEGRYWLSLFQATAPEQWRPRVLTGAAMLAYVQGDYKEASHLLQDCLSLQEKRENTTGIAATLDNLGIIAREQGSYKLSETFHQRSLNLRLELTARSDIAESYNNLGLAHLYQTNYERADHFFGQARQLWEEAHNIRGVARVMNNLGLLAFYQGEYRSAATLCQGGLNRFQTLSDTWGRAISLINLGRIALQQGDGERAAFNSQQSLILSREINYQENVAECLEALAGVFLAVHRAAPGVQFLSKADQLRHALGAPLPPVDRPWRDHTADMLRAELSSADYATAYAEGQVMSLEKIIALALDF